MQVAALEDLLGSRLFDRQPGGLVPTAAGRQFEATARPLFAELQAALRRIAAGVQQPAAVLAIGLRLAAPGSPAREAVAAVAAELGGHLPPIRLHALTLPGGAAAVQAGFTLDACERSATLTEHWILAGAAEGAEQVGLPQLPPAFAAGAAAQAAALGLTVVPLGWPPDRLDEAPRPSRLPILLPSLLLPGWLRDGKTALCRLLPLPAGPGWQLLGSADMADAEAALQPMLIRAFARRIGIAALRPPAEEPWPIAIEREQLDCFDAAWRHAGLTRAARELGIAQPAATLRLRRLEAALGQRLFQRHPHGLTPTPLGNALAPSAAAFLQDLGRLGPSLTRSRGQLRAGCVPALDEMSLLAEVLARSAADWNQRFPERRLHLIEGLSDELRRMVLNASIDCAFVDNDATQPGLVVRPITREPLVAVTAAGSGLLPPGPVPLGLLARLRLALPAPHHGLRWIVDQGAARAGLEVAPDAEIDSLAATIRLVRGGGWATLLPLGALRGAVQLGALQINAISDPPLERRICVVRRHGEALTSEALALVDLFSAHVTHGLLDVAAASVPDRAAS